VEGVQAAREVIEKQGQEKDAQADGLRGELEELRVSMSRLQVSHGELEAKHSHLDDEKRSVQKALEAEAAKLKSRRSRTTTFTRTPRLGN
jgi:phage shock protein A